MKKLVKKVQAARNTIVAYACDTTCSTTCTNNYTDACGGNMSIFYGNKGSIYNNAGAAASIG